ncbi:MAG: hypothetical protein CL955_03960 [Erythrobacteraceae bacterium]|nr:hypothetical protein [Erythrobacteraceae bacterium]
MRLIALSVLLLTGCAGSLESVRERGDVRATVTHPDFDTLVGCVGEQASARYDLNYAPNARGGSFSRSFMGIGGTSTMLVDVIRGEPAVAEVRTTGGPWLGQDDDLIERVRRCQA